jgi:SOS-response transcriptional repressor LexA
VSVNRFSNQFSPSCYNERVRQITPLGAFLREEIGRRHDGKVREAALYIGLAHTTIRDIILGASVPGRDTCSKIAIWAKLPEDEILRMAGYLPLHSENEAAESDRILAHLSHIGSMIEQRPIEVDIYGTVPAGYPRTEEQQIIGRVRIPPGALWIRVSGDSLVGLRIEHGDIIVVDPGNREPRRGQLAVVRLLTTNGFVRLEPANAKYKAIVATDVEVLGVVVGVFWEP